MEVVDTPQIAFVDQALHDVMSLEAERRRADLRNQGGLLGFRVHGLGLSQVHGHPRLHEDVLAGVERFENKRA